MKTSIFLLAVLLAGCGGGDGPSVGTGIPDTPPATPPATPAPMADAFFSSVKALLAGDADGEPVAVGDAALPVDGAEPQAVN